MPEYQAVIRSNIKGVNAVKRKVFASCFSDAEKMIKQGLKEDQYLGSLDNVNFPKDKFNIVDRR